MNLIKYKTKAFDDLKHTMTVNISRTSSTTALRWVSFFILNSGFVQSFIFDVLVPKRCVLENWKSLFRRDIWYCRRGIISSSRSKEWVHLSLAVDKWPSREYQMSLPMQWLCGTEVKCSWFVFPLFQKRLMWGTSWWCRSRTKRVIETGLG